MALVTCPFCGSIFKAEQRNCPNCTYRVPTRDAEDADGDEGPRTALPAVLQRTRGWFRNVADRLHSTFTPRD